MRSKVFRFFFVLFLFSFSSNLFAGEHELTCVERLFLLGYDFERVKEIVQTKDIVFIGPALSGKGTTAKHFLKVFDLHSFSMGATLRREADKKSELGLAAQVYTQAGELVPSEIAMPLIRQEIIRPEFARGLILDGSPRRLSEALDIEKLLAEMNREIDIIYYFLPPPPKVQKERLDKRKKKEGRNDDTLETLAKRTATYERETQPVLDHYEHDGRLVKLNTEGGEEDTFFQATMALINLVNDRQ